MNCQACCSLLGPYIDSELDTRTTLELQEHIAACAECAAALAAAERLEQQLQAALRTTDRDPVLWGRIEQQLGGVTSAEAPTATERRFALRSSPSTSVLGGDLARLAHGWRFWLWPSPRFYAALAALWMFLAFARLVSDDPPLALGTASGSSPLHSAELLADQRRLLAELLDQPESSAPPTTQPLHRTSSDRSELRTPPQRA